MLALLTVCSVAFSAQDQDKSRFEKLELFSKVLYLIESQYYRKVEFDKLIQGAIRGMMGSLDPHSSFLDENILKKMEEEAEGEFGGLGIEVTQKDGVIIIITPIDDTPAFRAGLKARDKIVEIDHESAIGISLEQALERMKGPLDTTITLGIIRQGEEGIKEFLIKREKIQIRPVSFSLVDKNFMYIRLKRFQKRSAEGIIHAIKELEKQAVNAKVGGPKGLILDLRSNPGGLLDEAVDVTSVFLESGIVVSTEGRDPKNKEIRYIKKVGHKELSRPMVVLINGASASASEIVAGALQDSNRAIIMGSQSFGKGSVQTVAKIDEKRGVKLTIAQYMTPSGKKIQAIGIKPDIELVQLGNDWSSKRKKRNEFIREKDLKNHLTATIETEKEKEKRRKREKKERLLRAKRLEDLKEKSFGRFRKDKNKENVVTKYNPNDDFQVVQAINYLKSFQVFKKMRKAL